MSSVALSVVNSVANTANQTAVNGTVNDPIIAIAATYVGQASITTLGTITTGTWNATAITETHGGTNQTTYTLGDTLYASAANTLSKLAGNTTAAIQYLAQTGTGVVSAAPAWTTISGGDITGAALTKTDDTNVTMTLGGTPATALLRAASMTLGWTGQLALTRGGSNANLTASNGGIVWSNATQMQILAGTATASLMLLSGSTATPTWSTSTIPTSAGATAGKALVSDGTNYVLSTPTFPNASATAGKIIRSDGTNWIASTSTFADTYSASTLLYSNGANTVTGLATANSGTLVTSSSGVPSILALGSTQTLVGVASATPAAAYIPGRNMIINGDFKVWQRGAGGTAVIAVGASTTAYTADRWQLLTNANQASTVTQNSFYTSGGDFCAQVQRNNAQTGTGVMRFCTSLTLDMCNSPGNFNGGVVTLSFKAFAGANFSPTSRNITVTVYSGTGTSNKSGINGAFTGSATIISQTQSISNSVVTNYSFTSSAIGATVTQLAVEFSWTPVGTAGAADTVDFTDVQLELSPVQTPFDRRNFNEVLLACQRFYWKSFAYNIAPAQASTSLIGAITYLVQVASTTAGDATRVQFPVQMLSAPTVVFYNPANSNTKWYDESIATDSGASSAINTSASSFSAKNPQVATDLASYQVSIHASADVDLV